MENLSRLCFGDKIHFAGLGGGQEIQNPTCDGWIQPKTFQGCDDAVTTKYSAEPGHSGIGIVWFRVADDHHFHIGLRTRDPPVELVARRMDLAGLASALGNLILGGAPCVPYDLGTPFEFGKISQEMVSSNVTWVRGSR